MNARSLALALASVALLVACGGKQAPELPAPEAAPAPTATTATGPNADSAAAAERERLERERREREAALAGAVGTDLKAMIHFDYDASDVRADDAANLDRKAAILGANPGVRLRISGHADERGSDEYNLALGMRRAAAAKRYLENKGVEGARLEVVSYGEERPLAAGSDEASWANNRRDEFEVTAGGTNLVAPQ
ncbi:MAG TPA: peptidoglycan-associated lipoprotein Pal [Gemmatimonadales bacterium]|nr:peptidoglycan-associated lipoprotein Pal [Gemmatimonadales bacterium]